MKKNIQIMIDAAIQMLHAWRKSVVFAVLLFALCLLEYFPNQWHAYGITSDVPLVLTQTLILVVFPLAAVRIISSWHSRDGYHWWRILGHVAGGVVGCIILLLVQDLIWSFTMDGLLKGWAAFAAATIILTALQTIVGWRDEH